ncbi:MAG: ATP-binding cassette domain-containing protein [Desulfuromonadaceae bacterium]|nr:ATP-binding cassette domain-containing protein [Desulfuromonadaceae bacterium]
MSLAGENLIEIQDLKFCYNAKTLPPHHTHCLNSISLTIYKGEFIALTGKSGSGKSTLAKMLNALLLPDSGAVRVNGMDSCDITMRWEIRRSVGVLFQDPDNQIIGTTVAEDAAFGPENLGLPPETIRLRVNEALNTVGMIEYGMVAPHLLNAVQKLKLSIAGILTMQPACIVVDESTALLNRAEQDEIIALLRNLNRTAGLTVLLITQTEEDLLIADRVLEIDAGCIKERHISAKEALSC